ncbi:hypothetical protein [Nocardioides sp. W7]|uniref:hypothetical protein n=1 Tax=Nocardioides sp. W7 TaxID=2931390 RepID=UPI001FD253CB|nr:hypothetical protein [Nocardioides sp. W7]
MSDELPVAEASILARAESRWLDQARERLRTTKSSAGRPGERRSGRTDHEETGR